MGKLGHFYKIITKHLSWVVKILFSIFIQIAKDSNGELFWLLLLKHSWRNLKLTGLKLISKVFAYLASLTVLTNLLLLCYNILPSLTTKCALTFSLFALHLTFFKMSKLRISKLFVLKNSNMRIGHWSTLKITFPSPLLLS